MPRRRVLLAAGVAVLVVPWAITPISATPGQAVTPTACRGALLPAGYAITDGIPHTIKTPYQPSTLHNPVSVVNLTRSAIRDTRSTVAQKRCLVGLGAESLIGKSTTRVIRGEVSRWLPYRFPFSPHPSVRALEPGWISGLAQAGAMTLMVDLYRYDGDGSWLDYGQQFANSYAVDIADGGFAHRASPALGAGCRCMPSAPQGSRCCSNSESSEARR